MNGLDLDLSQSQALWKFKAAEERLKPQQSFGSPEKKGMLNRGELLESLDLNISFESI